MSAGQGWLPWAEFTVLGALTLPLASPCTADSGFEGPEASQDITYMDLLVFQERLLTF